MMKRLELLAKRRVWMHRVLENKSPLFLSRPRWRCISLCYPFMTNVSLPFYTHSIHHFTTNNTRQRNTWFAIMAHSHHRKLAMLSRDPVRKPCRRNTFTSCRFTQKWNQTSLGTTMTSVSYYNMVSCTNNHSYDWHVFLRPMIIAAMIINHPGMSASIRILGQMRLTASTTSSVLTEGEQTDSVSLAIWIYYGILF